MENSVKEKAQIQKMPTRHKKSIDALPTKKRDEVE